MWREPRARLEEEEEEEEEGSGGGKRLTDFARSAHFPAKKCEQNCESSLPKCESMAKSLARVAVLWQAFAVTMNSKK